MVQKKEKTFEQAFEGAKRMSEKYVAKGPFKFFSDADIVETVQKGLAKNELKYGYRYCPWMTVSGDPVEDRKKICPCERHREDIARDGFCIWMFFVSEEFLRKMKEGEEIESTLADVVPLGETLFPEGKIGGKAEFKKARSTEAEKPK